MLTVLRIKGFRFFFYANENSEPRHIHVQKNRMLAKFWFHPAVLVSSSGFAAHELNPDPGHRGRKSADIRGGLG